MTNFYQHPYYWLFFAALIFPGCNFASKIDNPVAPPPPVRLTTSDHPELSKLPGKNTQQNTTEDQLQTVQASPVSSPESLVLARVNGHPIVLDEVLKLVGSQLIQDQSSLTDEEFRSMQNKRINTAIKTLLERQLLLQQARLEWPEAQIAVVHKQALEQFGKRLNKIMREVGVSTESELNARLSQDGSTLEELKTSHKDSFLAQRFLRSKIQDSMLTNRQQMLDYYQAHPDEFHIPAQVRWQHIEITLPSDHLTGRHSQCRCSSCLQGRRLKAKLDAETDFEALAREHSDGPRRADGGNWDWTRKGSLTEPVLDTLLFSIPPGTTSPVLEGASALHIVRILERKPSKQMPFPETQKEIRLKLQEIQLEMSAKEYIDQLYAKSEITHLDQEKGF